MALAYREITGLWSARVPDGPDSDQYPDTVLLEGHVTFEPEYRVPLVYPGEHIVIEPMQAIIHEGVLYGETVVGDDVVRGPLFLPVTVDEAANQSWSWVAKFQGMRLGEYGEEVSLPSVRFQVPPGGDALDLSAVIPVSQSGGTITVRGPAGPGLTSITAEDGALIFQWDTGRETAIDVPDAVPGTPGEDSTVPGPPPTVEWDGAHLVVGGERGPDLTGPEGPTAMHVVHHGTDPSVARPAGALSVYWVGSAEPDSAEDSDLWRRT